MYPHCGDPAFARDLARFGPRRSYAPMALSSARRYCRDFSLRQYENFTVVSVLLPRRLHQHFYNVYAYCRWADNLGDVIDSAAEALAHLRWWRDELAACYRGRPHHPVMVALYDTIRRFAIPKKPFVDLIYAFEQDQLIRHYRDWNQLLEYCRYSANPVGRIVLHLFRCYDEERAWLADRICTALQLTNFWQDVARDLDMGRVYLPQAERQRFGYTDADLYARRYTPEFADLMASLVERTEAMFREGALLADRVPPQFSIDVELFFRGGLAILDKIRALDYDVWKMRPVLTKTEKLCQLALICARKLAQRIGVWSPRRGQHLAVRAEDRGSTPWPVENSAARTTRIPTRQARRDLSWQQSPTRS